MYRTYNSLAILYIFTMVSNDELKRIDTLTDQHKNGLNTHLTKARNALGGVHAACFEAASRVQHGQEVQYKLSKELHSLMEDTKHLLRYILSII